MSESIYADLIGAPFRMGGRDPQTGIDCYGLYREIQHRLSRECPEFAYNEESEKSVIHRLIENGKLLWTPIEQPEPWCAVVFEIRPGYETHIGTMLPDLRSFIQASRALGRVVVSRMADVRWARKTRTYYR